MIQKLFLRPFVRRRMAAGHFGIILERFALDLQARGYALSTLQCYVQVAEHFSRWLGHHQIRVSEIDEQVIQRFVSRHLPHCRCRIPAACSRTACLPALGCLLRFVREQGLASKSPPQPTDHEVLVDGYDLYLDRSRDWHLPPGSIGADTPGSSLS